MPFASVTAHVAPERAHESDGQLQSLAAALRDPFEPVSVGEEPVDHHQVKRARAPLFVRFCERARLHDLVTARFQRGQDELSEVDVIVDDENARGHLVRRV